jgi:hypothetical protein
MTDYNQWGGDGGEIPQIRADLPCQPCDKFTYSRAVVPKKCVNTWCVISNSPTQAVLLVFMQLVYRYVISEDEFAIFTNFIFLKEQI